jgi:hypothetical protein
MFKPSLIRSGEWPRLSVFALAALAVLPRAAWSYSVGEAELLSEYSQPLRVRVPLEMSHSNEAVTAGEISARLLPLSAYSSLGLVAPPIAPEQIQVEVEGAGLSYQVHLSSRQLIREPFITLMLEVRVGGVRTLREMPLIFDLPGIAPVTAAAPAVETKALMTESVALKPVPVTAVAEPATPGPAVEVSPPAQRSTPRSRRAERRTAQRSAPERTMFRLADWNPSYSAQMPLPRFQLDSQFESYRQLVASGLAAVESAAATPSSVTSAPVPVTETGSVPTEEIAASAMTPEQRAAIEGTGQTAEFAGEKNETAVREPSGGGWLWWLLAGIAAAAGGFLAWQRRIRPDAGAPDPTLATAAASAPAEPSEPQMTGPAPEAPASVERALAAAPQIEPETLARPATPSAEPVVLAAEEPSDSGAAASLRARVGDLLSKTMDQNHRRKLQLVEAYLDLGRVQSAGKMLSELENDLLPKAPARIPFTLIKG